MPVLLAALVAHAAQDLVDVRVVTQPPPTRNGPILYALRVMPKKGWHLYWKNPGDSGVAPTVTWELPEGWTAEPVEFPTPSIIAGEGMVSYGYEKEFALVGRIRRTGATGDPPKTLKGKLDWMACAESCTTGTTPLAFDVPDLMPFVGIEPPRLLNWQTFERLIPRTPAKASATYAKGVYTLTVEKQEGGQGYFYCETEGTIAHQAKQTVTYKDRRLTFSLPKSEYADKPAERLKGLVKVSGRDSSYSLVIDVPVQSK